MVISFICCLEPPKDTGGDQIIGYILEIDDGKGILIDIVIKSITYFFIKCYKNFLKMLIHLLFISGGLFQKIYHGSDREFMIDQRKPGHSYKLRVASESKAGIGSVCYFCYCVKIR